MKTNCICYGFAILLAIGIETACLAGPPTAFEEIAHMGTGINLGNTFDAPDGEGTWCPQLAQPAFFDDFKAAGLKHVRLPVTWQKHMCETNPYTVDAKFLDRIAEVVGWANQRGLIVVLNAHHEEWFKNDPGARMNRLAALWRQLAARFKDVPDQLLVFEVLNESDAKHITAFQTTEMNQRILQVIRETNPTRCVIIGAVGDNAQRLVDELQVPNDPYIIATYHCYDPWFFVCGEPRNPAESTWGSDTQKADYLKIMDPIKKWSVLHHVPIYLGEWGTSTKCETNSRVEYYRFVSAQAAARGFGDAIWDEGGNMLIYDRTTRQWNTNILQAVFPASGVFKGPIQTEPTDLPLFKKEVFRNVRNELLPFQLLSPTHIDPSKKYPLVLFLHGAAARGDDNESQLAEVPQMLLNAASGKEYACFVLAPQCPTSDAWAWFPQYPLCLTAQEQSRASRLTLEIIDSLVKKLNIDPQRIYVTGLSLGGEGTFDIITRRTNFFAAAVPVCGIADTNKVALMKSTPLWIFHGDSDDINSVAYSRDIVKSLNEQGVNPRYNEYKGVKHDSWTKAYQEPDLLSWIFKQKLEP